MEEPYETGQTMNLENWNNEWAKASGTMDVSLEENWTMNEIALVGENKTQ
jgi:hypothetical protein